MSKHTLSLREFIIGMAMLVATTALAIDALLPALPYISADLTPLHSNQAQFTLGVFVMGLGFGTLICGPLSDRFGRKPIILLGLALYCAASLLAIYSKDFQSLLIARLIQGFASAAPRIVGTAIIRDLYAGRDMARINSFIMMIFILIPAVAPALATGVLAIADHNWRMIFWLFIGFAGLSAIWLSTRVSETLPTEKRTELNLRQLSKNAAEILNSRPTMIYTAILTLGFGQMFGLLSSIQQIYDDVFDMASQFPAWFALQAILAGFGGLINARIVKRVGMRKMVSVSFGAKVALSCLVLGLTLLPLPHPLEFTLFFIWSVGIFTMAGLTFGNLTSLALTPFPHIAGLGASLVMGISSIFAAIIAGMLGYFYNETVIPLTIGALMCSILASLLMRDKAVLADQN